jgi:cytochrome c556
MSGVRHSSASVPTESPAGSPTSSQPEAEMKDKIPREFECATFVDDLTAQGAPLQADPNDVQRVLDHLRDNCELTHVIFV